MYATHNQHSLNKYFIYDVMLIDILFNNNTNSIVNGYICPRFFNTCLCIMISRIISFLIIFEDSSRNNQLSSINQYKKAMQQFLKSEYLDGVSKITFQIFEKIQCFKLKSNIIGLNINLQQFDELYSLIRYTFVNSQQFVAEKIRQLLVTVISTLRMTKIYQMRSMNNIIYQLRKKYRLDNYEPLFKYAQFNQQQAKTQENWKKFRWLSKNQKNNVQPNIINQLKSFQDHIKITEGRNIKIFNDKFEKEDDEAFYDRKKPSLNIAYRKYHKKFAKTNEKHTEAFLRSNSNILNEFRYNIKDYNQKLIKVEDELIMSIKNMNQNTAQAIKTQKIEVNNFVTQKSDKKNVKNKIKIKRKKKVNFLDKVENQDNLELGDKQHNERKGKTTQEMREFLKSGNYKPKIGYEKYHKIIQIENIEQELIALRKNDKKHVLEEKKNIPPSSTPPINKIQNNFMSINRTQLNQIKEQEQEYQESTICFARGRLPKQISQILNAEIQNNQSDVKSQSSYVTLRNQPAVPGLLEPQLEIQHSQNLKVQQLNPQQIYKLFCAYFKIENTQTCSNSRQIFRYGKSLSRQIIDLMDEEQYNEEAYERENVRDFFSNILKEKLFLEDPKLDNEYSFKGPELITIALEICKEFFLQPEFLENIADAVIPVLQRLRTVIVYGNDIIKFEKSVIHKNRSLKIKYYYFHQIDQNAVKNAYLQVFKKKFKGIVQWEIANSIPSIENLYAKHYFMHDEKLFQSHFYEFSRIGLIVNLMFSGYELQADQYYNLGYNTLKTSLTELDKINHLTPKNRQQQLNKEEQNSMHNKVNRSPFQKKV